MPYIIPTVEQIEDYLESLEELLFSSLSAATPDLPNVRQAIQRLWEDVSRYGPQALPPLPDLHIPGLGAFEVPPPPPPPPPPKSFVEKSTEWIADHKWTATGVGIGIIGAGLLTVYGTAYYQQNLKPRKVRATTSTERRQVVVILGGDTPLGLPLILDLEVKGYIVITSVSTPEAVEEIEARTNGYVRALVLDPSEPETVTLFLRSLSSTMSRRFPITAAGDPHAHPSTHTYIQSIISLLTLPDQDEIPPFGPLEHLSLRDEYLPYLQTTHITPLRVIQGLLPLLRTTPARSRDTLSNNQGKKSVIVCLPVTDARVGLPFASAQAMSAAATQRAAEVLRRELRISSAAKSSAALKNIKVVTIDVGSIGDKYESQVSGDGDEALVTMQDWSESERDAYGRAFSNLATNGPRLGVRRRPSDASVFVNAIVKVIKDGRDDAGFNLPLRLSRFWEWIRGNHVTVGAGAGTYAIASRLPTLVLDSLLAFPHILISIRNALLLTPPTVPDPPPQQIDIVAPAPRKVESASILSSSDHEHTDNDVASDHGSEADVESNSGYGSGVGESWISLKKNREESP
ncbi:unnamed protein product [Somion occarium]|uniref:DUF1776-domain-containing protein n=1 Tax=Somion occarium TaxID=3059160 RepID=A0ABP1DBK6_9APHY